MADRQDFEIDVELETGLIRGHAGVPGLIEAFRGGGDRPGITLKRHKRGLSASEMVESLWRCGGRAASGLRISTSSGRTRRWRRCWGTNCRGPSAHGLDPATAIPDCRVFLRFSTLRRRQLDSDHGPFLDSLATEKVVKGREPTDPLLEPKPEPLPPRKYYEPPLAGRPRDHNLPQRFCSSHDRKDGDTGLHTGQFWTPAKPD